MIRLLTKRRLTNLKYGIIAVGYNRPHSLKRLIASVVAAEYGTDTVDLIISIDRSNNQDEVAAAVADTRWQHGQLLIVKQEVRLGLRPHVMKCGDYTEQYDAIIMLEDDLVVSPFFFSYVKATIEKYDADSRVAGISLYKHETHPGACRPFLPADNGYDAYLMQFAQSWGQCWTKRMWQEFRKWYADNSEADLGRDSLLPAYIASWDSRSWLKYFMRYLVETGKYFVYPYVSLSTNASETGEHNGNSNNDYQVPLLLGKKEYRFPDFDSAIKYDAYFERQNIADKIFLHLEGEKIIDLYGQKQDFTGADYLISTQALPYKQELSFQMKYRPHEANCFHVEDGNDVFVYNLKVPSQKPQINENNLTRYDVRTVSGDRLLRLGLKRFLAILKAALSARIKRVLHIK